MHQLKPHRSIGNIQNFKLMIRNRQVLPFYIHLAIVTCARMHHLSTLRMLLHMWPLVTDSRWGSVVHLPSTTNFICKKQIVTKTSWSIYFTGQKGNRSKWAINNLFLQLHYQTKNSTKIKPIKKQKKNDKTGKSLTEEKCLIVTDSNH